MKIPVKVNVKTKKHLSDNGGAAETETRETVAPGFIHATRGGLRLEYTINENNPEGEWAETTVNVNLIGENMVAMNQGGAAGAYMVFEKGKTHSCVFHNGFFPMELRVSTRELKNTISKSGGRLDLDYTIDIVGSRAEKSHISLAVFPHAENITS